MDNTRHEAMKLQHWIAFADSISTLGYPAHIEGKGSPIWIWVDLPRGEIAVVQQFAQWTVRVYENSHSFVRGNEKLRINLAIVSTFHHPAVLAFAVRDALRKHGTGNPRAIAVDPATLRWLLCHSFEERSNYLSDGDPIADYGDEWRTVAQAEAAECDEAGKLAKQLGETDVRWNSLAARFLASAELAN
jgi:hypothetical protein